MTVTMDKTVREFALENPTATRVFEKLGIDYCCGGNRSLQDACDNANLTSIKYWIRWRVPSGMRGHAEGSELADRASREFNRAYQEHPPQIHAGSDCPPWSPVGQSLLSPREKPSGTARIREIFQGLAQELTTHLMKEEVVLFPHIVRMEEATVEMIESPASFGIVKNPVSMMEQEHDSAGNALRAMRMREQRIYSARGWCVSYQTLYRALAEFRNRSSPTHSS